MKFDVIWQGLRGGDGAALREIDELHASLASVGRCQKHRLEEGILHNFAGGHFARVFAKESLAEVLDRSF